MGFEGFGGGGGTVIPPGSITTVELADYAVTNIKLGTSSVSVDKLDSTAQQVTIFPLNHLTNPGFDYAQLYNPAAAFSPVDNAVGFDAWKTTFAAGGGVDCLRGDNLASPFWKSYVGQYKRTGAAGKIGFYQAIELSRTRNLRNKPLCFQFPLYTSSAMTLTLALIGYDGAADTIPALISAWNGSGVNPTLTGPNLSYIGTYDAVQGAGDRGFWGIYGVVPNTINNLIVAVFSKTLLAGGDYFEVAEMGLYDGFALRTTWSPLSAAENLSRVERFIEKSYNADVIPGTVTNDGVIGGIQSGVNSALNIPFRVRKPKTPVITTYNPASGATGEWRDIIAASNLTMVTQNEAEVGANAVVFGGGTDGNRFTGHFVANASL